MQSYYSKWNMASTSRNTDVGKPSKGQSGKAQDGFGASGG